MNDVPPGEAQTLPPKIGVIAPTLNRPDFARLLVLQMANQTLPPHVVCVHQNGTPQSYQWTITDIRRPFDVHWIHTPIQIAQEEWYAIPLARLIDQGCTMFFWCDHDDIYTSNHIAAGVELLKTGQFDFSINRRAGLLLLKQPYEFHSDTNFTPHDPGGMSSSMSFNRAFAIELLSDLRANNDALQYADQVLNRVTKPKFRCHVSEAMPTTSYVCHPETVSSRHWLTE